MLPRCIAIPQGSEAVEGFESPWTTAGRALRLGASVGDEWSKMRRAVDQAGSPQSTHAAQKYGCLHFGCDRTKSCALRSASAVGRPGFPSFGFHNS